MKYLLVWLAVISVTAAVVTLYDKIAAKKGAWRIPEKTLLMIGFIGGAAAEYAVMQAIRHKTKHKKFMITLPLFIVLHVGIAVAVLYFCN